MTFFFEDPQVSRLDTFAGGEASMGDIASAAYDSMLYTGQLISSENAIERAYDDRIEAVRNATGIVLDNPRRMAWPDQSELTAQAAASQPENLAKTRQRLFTQRLSEIAAQHPDARSAIRPEVSIEEDAARIAAQSDRRFGQLASSRDGIGKWAAMFAGGAAAAIQDPVQAYSLAIGAGSGTGATVAGRILNVALKEALINGATEAVSQPAVQAWRSKIGLESGLGEAAKSVAFSALLGGLFGGVAGGAGEVFARLAPGERDAAAGALRSAAQPDTPLARALDGDTAAQARVLAPIRDALPAAERGALDAIERAGDIAAARPIGADLDKHERMAASAERAVTLDDSRQLISEPDFDQVERIAHRLVGPIDGDAAPAVDSLSTFLMRKGGLLDQKGEVSAVAGGNVSERFVGKLIREDGVPLDRARELAAEAGYLDGRYGSPELAMERSTPADLLDLLDEDLRGTKVYPGGDSRLSHNVDTEMAYVSDLVASVAREMGAGIPDHLIERAIRLVQSEKLDVAEAAERVLIHADDPVEVRSTEETLAAEAGGLVDFRKWTRAHVGDRLAGMTVRNVDDGSEILITRQGLKKAMSNRLDRVEILATTKLDELIAIARHVGTVPDRKGRTTLKAVHYYRADVKVDGETAPIEIVVREAVDGRRYYQHVRADRRGGDGGGGEGGGPPPGEGPEGPSIQDHLGPPIPKIGLRDEDGKLGIPGWTDEEMDAAMAARPAEPVADGLDDPAAAMDEAELLTTRDVAELPPEQAGEWTAMLDELDAERDVISLIEACGV